MKTLRIVLFFMALGLGHSQAQVNLVPNPSFEDTISCPQDVSGMFGDEIYNLIGWFPAKLSADYFNICSSSQVSVPSNGFGYQLPADGNAYIGIFAIATTNLIQNYREIIGIQLTQNLSIGTTYYYKMHVSAGYGGIQSIYHHSNNVGAVLSTQSFESSTNPYPINNHSLVKFDTIFSDTTNWLSLTASFIADSA